MVAERKKREVNKQKCGSACEKKKKKRGSGEEESMNGGKNAFEKKRETRRHSEQGETLSTQRELDGTQRSTDNTHAHLDTYTHTYTHIAKQRQWHHGAADKCNAPQNTGTWRVNRESQTARGAA